MNAQGSRVLAVAALFLSAVAPLGAAENQNLCNEDGAVKYRAKWAGKKVVLTASGTHRTGGYTVSFEESMLRIFPPQFSLVHKKPDGIVTQAITPFKAETSFAATEKPQSVVVHDARGKQTVPVE